MVNIILISIIVIAVVLVVLALFVWRRRKELKLEGMLEGISKERKKAFFAQWIIGIVLALTAAAFMFDGDILGEDTTGISTILGIIGICLIATSNVHLLSLRHK
jgi:Na+/H+ antiporter NhaD/arsenite permease-like protein